MRLLLILFLYLPAAMSVVAQEKEPCGGANTQLEMNQCYGERYKAADKELNEAYRKLLTNLDSQHKLKVQEAQRAWIKFRDQHCEATTFISVGGSIHTLELVICRDSLTRQRTEQLTTMLKSIDNM